MEKLYQITNLKIKKMRTLQKKSTVLVVTLLFAVVALAQPNSQNQQNRGKGQQANSQNMYKQQCHQERMASHLELTEQQTEQLQALRLTHQQKMLFSRNELGEKKAKMQTLSTANPADMKAINTLIDEMSVVKVAMMKEKAAHKQEVRKLLSEEQRIKFDMYRHNKGRGHGNRQGNGNGHGQCYR